MYCTSRDFSSVGCICLCIDFLCMIMILFLNKCFTSCTSSSRRMSTSSSSFSALSSIIRVKVLLIFYCFRKSCSKKSTRSTSCSSSDCSKLLDVFKLLELLEAPSDVFCDYGIGTICFDPCETASWTYLRPLPFFMDMCFRAGFASSSLVELLFCLGENSCFSSNSLDSYVSTFGLKLSLLGSETICAD